MEIHSGIWSVTADDHYDDGYLEGLFGVFSIPRFCQECLHQNI